MTDHDLLDAARHAVAKLGDAWACVHGPEYDSASWGNDCGVCDAMRPLVLAIERAEASAPPSPTVAAAVEGGP